MRRNVAAAVCAVILFSTLAFVASAQAQITRILITRVESPTFEGVAFGETGPYQKIVGRAFGEIDPGDPRLANPTHTLTAPSATPSARFAVRMMIRPKMVSEARTPGSVMGVALAADQNGGTLSLFYDRVMQVVRHYHQPIADILALAMAHEVDHLLLPPPSHSATGIMRASWDGDDIRHAVVGQLLFTAREASLMREKLTGCCGTERSSAAR